MLLSREEFRRRVFERDGHKCVVCASPAVDAHHILERKLFPDGGYYLDNGASLCADCHLKAEQTIIGAQQLRDSIGIKSVVLPPQLLPDQEYDKWGNPVLPNGHRLRGELFHTEGAQKMLASVLSSFTHLVKYPRTRHLPWSPGASSGDIFGDPEVFSGTEVVVTEKMDGENTTMYRDYIHARSVSYSPHSSRDFVKSMHASIRHDIPSGWRVCGENMYAVHSIKYEALPSYFLAFSLWDSQNFCLAWDETVLYLDMLGIVSVPVLYRGLYSESAIKDLEVEGEGYVVRPSGRFHYSEFGKFVLKYVRKNHVRTSSHWMTEKVRPNGLAL